MQHGHVYIHIIYVLDDMIDEVYVHTTILLIWLMMFVYFYIWWRMMWGQSVLGIKKLYNMAKLCLNPFKFYSVPYHITIFYTRICCMTRWLKKKKHGEKKKRLPCPTSFLIFSPFETFHTCFVALFRYIHLRSFPTVSLWGIHQLWTVPFMETAPRVVNG